MIGSIKHIKGAKYIGQPDAGGDGDSPGGEDPGGAPEWVPEGATEHIDFAGNRAWTEGGGEVALATIVGTDDTDSLWGPSDFIAENIQEDGYLFADSIALALIGDLRASVLAGATIRIQWKSSSDVFTELLLMIGMADGSALMDLSAKPLSSSVQFQSSNGTFDETISGLTVGPDSVNCVATTVTSTRGEFSLNGSAADTASLTEDDYPASGYEVALIQLADGSVLQSLTVMNALPDATGLPALSAVA